MGRTPIRRLRQANRRRYVTWSILRRRRLPRHCRVDRLRRKPRRLSAISRCPRAMPRLTRGRPTPRTSHAANPPRVYLTLHRQELRVNPRLSPTFFPGCLTCSRTTAHADRARRAMTRRETATTITKPNRPGLSRRRGAAVLRFFVKRNNDNIDYSRLT